MSATSGTSPSFEIFGDSGFADGGALALEQIDGDPVVLRSTLTEYVPRLTGTLYFQVQARLHSLISRRHFARLGRAAR